MDARRVILRVLLISLGLAAAEVLAGSVEHVLKDPQETRVIGRGQGGRVVTVTRRLAKTSRATCDGISHVP